MSELDLRQLFPFDLDRFQLQAIEALNDGKSAIVCAPTGSGKTLIGEYAIHRALTRGKRVFYTTPLKALSNQKLRDFREKFGNDKVGLLTGDIAIEREAPILVMTTEIFRNMLYGTPIGEVGTSVRDVETVVLDECHYMNDRQRGTVWEEAIVYAPPGMQLVGLSATVANSGQLADWIAEVHGPTELVYSDYRPVPLEFNYCSGRGMFPLLDRAGKAINPKIRPQKLKKGKFTKRSKKPPRPRPLAPSFVVSKLAERDMLPAIYFIFSRRGCDKAVAEMGTFSLLDAEQTDRIAKIIDAFVEENPGAVRESQLEPLYRGIAAHHAGVLPAWKSLVESLFQQGLIKVVFATETLAAGINMPARATVIAGLSKRTDSGHRLLTASEFLQMAGRAGRRGMDDRGYVVALESPFEGAKEAAHLATIGADPLVSQFTPTYGMVLNLLQIHSLDRAKDLVERSFGQYLANLSLKPQQDEVANVEARLGQAQAQIADLDLESLENYRKLQERLQEERRILKTLRDQAEDVGQESLVLALRFAVAGTVLNLKGPNVTVAEPISAVLVGKAGGGDRPLQLVCLSANNTWYAAMPQDVVHLFGNIPRLSEVDEISWPQDLVSSDRPIAGMADTLAIAERIPQVPPPEIPPEVAEWQDRVAELEVELEAHPVQQVGNPKALLKQLRRVERLEEQLQQRQEAIERNLGRHWQDFLDLIDILLEFSCLEESMQPTELGEAIAALRGDNELWLGLALMSHEFEDLEMPQFTAACAAVTVEVTRPDAWTAIDPSREVLGALDSVKSLRRRVFQVQRRYDVALPVWFDREFVGLVEQWAEGAEWEDLCGNTSLDDGDIVRVLRRTLDVLSQIPHVPHLSDRMKSLARDAAYAVNRFPVKEDA
ncbi:MAG: DEAD/DEAH box helicase [Geitlerinemataceae cyanobacterium]